MEIRPIFSALLRSKTAPMLVAVQVAISLAILANALFIVQLRIASSERPSGVDDEHSVFYFRVTPLDKSPHNETIAQQQRDLAVLKAVPGVVSAAWTSQMPLSRSGTSGSVTTRLDQKQATAEPSIYYAHEGFVHTLGLRLVEGRDFNRDDIVELDPDVDLPKDKHPKTVIVTRALAELLFPGATGYVGRSFFFGIGDGNEVRVVGVVDALQTVAGQRTVEGELSAILPWRISLPFSRYAVRAEPGQRDRVMLAAEEALRKASPRPSRISPRTVDEDRAERYRNEKALAWMLIAVCVLLLMVTVSGIVGMTTLRVAQRRKQIGVRRALGARRRDILRYFVTENVLITTAGIVAGLVLALALNQLLIRHLELTRLPLAYLAYGAAALWLLGVAAVWGPASRAAGTPPAIATRTA
jgi:putative ABC transport system permease protein